MNKTTMQTNVEVLSRSLASKRQYRAEISKNLQAIVEQATRFNRSLNPAETKSFERFAAELKEYDLQIARSEAALTKATNRPKKRRSSNTVTVKSEPLVYDAYSPHSYFADLAALQVRASGLDRVAATERIARHGRQVEVEARNRPHLAWMTKHARSEPESRSVTGMTTVNSYGGDLVPPLWLIDDAVPFYRPGRAIANRVKSAPLPPGTDSINVPKIATGTTVAAQYATTNSMGTVSETDWTTSSLSAAVNTIAGQSTASLQLLEQSPAAVDELIWTDLTRAYDQALDQQVLYGSGTSGQHQGVLTYAATVSASIIFTSSTASTAFTASGGVYPSIIKAVNTIEMARYASPTAIWLSPRRANSFAAQFDSSGRPLFHKASYGNFNSVGIAEGVVAFEGSAGELYGLPVIKDANVPSTWNSTSTPVATSGGTQDPIVVVKEDDLRLWEGPLRLRALPEVQSGNLAVVFQAYAYSAFMPNRTATAIAVVTGPVMAAAQLGY